MSDQHEEFKQSLAEHRLVEIIEIGCVFIANYGDQLRLFKNVTVQEAQEEDTLPFAKVSGGYDGKRLAVLFAFIVAEHMKNGKLELPDFLTEGVQSAAELEAEIIEGNTGTVDDNINIRILGQDGHPLDTYEQRGQV